MCIDKYLIQPNSPEHYDYFLGWFYRSSVNFKKKIWQKIQSGEEKIEFNEFYFIVDLDNYSISVYSIYDTGTHNSFFSKEEWKLTINLNDFEVITGIKEVDYNNYYEIKNNCELCIFFLNDNFKVYHLETDIVEDIKTQLNLMCNHMDLNVFYPNYHLIYQQKLKNNDFLLFLYELALLYIKYAKPIDIIAKSNLCK